MIATLDSVQVEARKRATLAAQPIRRMVSVRDIKVVTPTELEVLGTPIKTDQKAMQGLFNHLGLGKRFMQKFETLFTAENSILLVNRMREAIAQAGNGDQVWLVADPNTMRITQIYSDRSGFGRGLSNGEFINFAESLISEGNMSITNWSVDPDGGLVQINAFAPSAEVALKNFNGAGKEVFTGGINISLNQDKGVLVSPYINRMFCANGMTRQLAEDTFILNSLDSTTLEKFYQSMDQLKKSNYMPAQMRDRVQMSMVTPASMAEMRKAYNWVEGIAGERADQWIPYKENRQAYARIGMEEMSWHQMTKAKSNTSVWDLVNGVTHMATHGGRYMHDWKEEGATQLMVQAGNLLGDDQHRLHHEGEVPTPFNGLVPMGSLLN